MKLSELKSCLEHLHEVRFTLTDGNFVAPHFHITEIGSQTKKFLDCGTTIREQTKIRIQLWVSDDFEHRITGNKFYQMLLQTEQMLSLDDHEIEVEFQTHTIGLYHLRFQGQYFVLESTQTDCLAKELCGRPKTKQKINLAQLSTTNCTPGNGCC